MADDFILAESPSGRTIAMKEATIDGTAKLVQSVMLRKSDGTELGVGTAADTKVQTDASGTLTAFLRGIVSWFADLIETRAQTPTKTKAINVQIGPGDVISNLPVVILYDHHQNHEGEAYQWTNKSAVNNTTKHIRLSVPNVTATTRTPHLLIFILADQITDIVLYEGTTWTSGGTQETTYCRNRNNVTIASGMKIYLTGGTALTVNAQGTAITSWYLTPAKVNTTVDDTNEWILKTNTEYDLAITTSNNTNVLVRLYWYEDQGV